MVIPLHVLVEFASILRSLTVRRRLSGADSHVIFEALLGISTLQSWHEEAPRRGFALVIRLGQSDTFDATGYAVAERLGAEFWVSDRRFANAAASAGLGGVRLVP